MQLACRSAVAEALPQLQVLDGVPLAGERACLAAEHRPAAQHLAELQLQAYEPQRPGSIVEQQQLAAACPVEDIEGVPEQAPPWPVPVIFLQGATPAGSGHLLSMQQLSEVPGLPGGLPELPGGDTLQNLADRLAQRLAQSGTAPPGQPSSGSAGQEQRWASLEARVAALQSRQLGDPIQVHRPQGPPSQSLPGVREDNAAGTVQMQPAGKHGSRCSIEQVDPHKVQELQVGCNAAYYLGVSSCSVIQDVRSRTACQPRLLGLAWQRAMHAVQKDAEDLRAELGAVRAEMGRAAQQAEAARQDTAKNVCRIQTECEAQVCLCFQCLLCPVI